VEKLGDKNRTSEGKSRFHICHIKSIKDFKTMSFVVAADQTLVVCMSPGIMCRLQRTLRLFAFSHAVLDEVHLYSRPRTKGYQALARILNKVSERVLLLTANPV
jgi:CRISPR/Cas system-associated endonuclease/helicase Cas3